MTRTQFRFVVRDDRGKQRYLGFAKRPFDDMGRWYGDTDNPNEFLTKRDAVRLAGRALEPGELVKLP